MTAQRNAVERPSSSSLWDELAQERIMEPTEVIVIQRSFPKRLFGTFYEHLGSLILLNLAVTIQLGAGVLVGYLVAVILHLGSVAGLALIAIGGLAAVAPAWAGLFCYVRAICDDDAMPSLRDYARGMRAYAVRSWILALAQGLSGLLLALNIRFYAQLHGGIALPVLLVVLSMTLIWAMAGVYAWPLLVRDLRWIDLLRNSALLALAAPFSTIVLLAGLTAISAVLIVTRVGWVLGVFSIWALAENVSMGRLVRIFRARQEALAQARDEQAQSNA